VDNPPAVAQDLSRWGMRIPKPPPAALGSTPFTCREALDAGSSQRRLRHRELLAPSRGIRVPVVLPDPSLGPMVRPLTVVTEFSAASHATAFRLWALPGFLPGADGPGIHISRPDTMAIPRRTEWSGT
jgi:hypothetical protein